MAGAIKISFFIEMCIRDRFCLGLCGNIRIDTHRDNRTMRHLIEKSGFARCGLIHVEDGSPRIAYQYAARGEGKNADNS